MLDRDLHVRLDEATAARLETLADTWHVTRSQAIRDAIDWLLSRPQEYGSVLAKRLGYEHRPTPAQQRNAEVYVTALASVDLAQLHAQMRSEGTLTQTGTLPRT